MRSSRRSSFLPALASVVAPLFPQGPSAVDTVRHAIAPAHCLFAEGDRLIAEGDRYHATFTAAAVEFVPALGESAPHAQVLRLRLHSIARGSTQLARETAVSVPAIHGDTVVYMRGAAEERFTVQSCGLALSVHFAAMPPGEGDLVVRYEVDGGLPFAAADAGGLRFALQQGGVRIGGVTGVAADGRRTAGTVRYADGVVELALPHEFVATARYPLVLDPLIGPELPVTAADVDGEPDVAFDASTGRHLVVWRRTFAADRRLIRAQLITALGAAVGSLILVRDNPGSGLLCRHPTVANIAVRDRFVVAWDEAFSLTSASTVQCQTVDASTGALSTQIQLSAPGAIGRDPCAAGDNGTDVDALVVWSHNDSDVRVVPVTVNATGFPVLGSAISVVGTFPSHRTAHPVISRSQNSASRYLVVWQNVTVSALHARSYDRDLLSPGPVLTILATAAGEEFAGLAVDGDGARFTVAWGQTRLPSGQRDVRCVSLRADQLGVLQLNSPIRDLEGSPGVDAFDPAVAFLGPKFTVAWTRIGNGDTTVEGIDIAPDCTACGRPWAIAGANTLQSQAALATDRAAGAASEAALLVCTDAAAIPPFTARLTAQRLAAFGPGIPPVTAGPGCGNAGLISTSGGPFALANDEFRVLLRGAPPGGIVFIDIGFPGNEIVCGTCTFTNGFVVQFVPAVAGSAQYLILAPCVPAYLGLVLSAQWLVFGTATSPCPTAPGLAATARLHLTVSE